MVGFVLQEYYVSPNPDKRHEYTIVFENNTINFNGNIINDVDVINSIISIMNEFKERFEKTKTIQYSNYKGGLQENLSFVYDEERYSISGNTNSEEINKLYKEFKNAVVPIISK
jgi:hypothetical protein